MELIHEPIEKDKLLSELTPEKFLRYTRRGGNHIYLFTYIDSPNLMLEVARLRELSFRHAGGGSGKEYDLDHFDVRQKPFKQLIVWNPDDQEIVGGYRFSVCAERNISYSNQRQGSPFTEHFKLSHKFIKQYLPVSIELGRAWIQPKYQANGIGSRNYIFSLDNLWDGLGAVIHTHPRAEYLFGKITIYSGYEATARNILLWFLNHYFGEREDLITPLHPVKRDKHIKKRIPFRGNDLRYDYNLLSRALRSVNESIPPLINAYIRLSDRILITGTTFDPLFGNVYETGIIIRVEDIHPEKLERYVGSMKKELQTMN